MSCGYFGRMIFTLLNTCKNIFIYTLSHTLNSFFYLYYLNNIILYLKYFIFTFKDIYFV